MQLIQIQPKEQVIPIDNWQDMADLAAALERHTGPQPELFANLLLLDSFQDICDFELSRYLPISPQQIPTIIDIGHDVRRFLEPLFHEKEIDS